MKSERKILTSAIILGSGEFVGQLANFVFVIALARQFGAGRLGQYSLAMSIGYALSIFMTLGVHELLTRQIGQDPERGQAAIGGWLPAEVVSALTVWTGLALASWWLPISRDLQIVLLALGAYQLIWRFGAIFALQFSARGQMIIPALSDCLHRIMILLVAGAAMMLHVNAHLVLMALPVVAALVVVWVAWQARRTFGAPRLRWDRGEIISLLSRAQSFFVMGGLGIFQAKIGIILLAAIAGNTAVGMYAAADRLVLPLLTCEMLLIKAAYPEMLRLWSSDRQRMLEVSARCLRLLLLVSIPASGIIFAFRNDLVLIIFGEEFRSAAAPLAVLAWLPIFGGMRALWDAQAITAQLQRQAAIAKTLAFAVLLAGVLLAIFRHQEAGLAIVVLSAEAVHAALLFVLLARQGMVPTVVSHMIGPVCAAAIAILSSMTVMDHGLLMRIPVVVGATILGLLLFGGVRLQDVRFLADALNKKSKVG